MGYSSATTVGRADGDLVDAALMASALEVGVEEGVDDVERFLGGDEATGEYEDVGVVVAACQACDLGLPAEGGTDELVLVERDADAVACSADGDGGVDFACLDGTGAGVGIVGVVTAFG